MSELEKLNIVLAARDREFARAMERNTKRVERFTRQSGKNLSRTTRDFSLLGMASKRLGLAMAALGAGAMIAKLKGTIATLDDIGKTADKMGLTTDALQELRTIAESAGMAQSSLDSSLERLNKRLGEAALGTGAAAKALKDMGLEASDLATMGLDKALSVIADKIAGIAEPTERAARAAALFGREGVAMVNLLREGSAGMEAMRQEARDLGIVIDESLIRGAEDAQTKLDLMSRVISAQLNSALVELAPLLVGGATAIADFARGLVAAIEAVKSFISFKSDLEVATDNMVLALGDEIRQSQLLETALGRGVNMSAAAAVNKIEEARARHENVAAIIAEHRALAMSETGYDDLTDVIARTTSEIEEMQSVNERAAERGINLPGLSGDAATQAAEVAAAYERLNAAIVARDKIVLEDDELNAQLERTAENIATLETALANAKGGVVSVDGSYIAPIETGPRAEISNTGSAAAIAIPELSDYADVMARIEQVFGSVETAGDSYADTMAKLQALYDAGEISADEYAAAVGAIEERFDAAAAGAKRLEDIAANAFVSIVTGSESAGDAISGLLSQLAAMAAKSAFTGLFGGSNIFSSLAPIFDAGVSFDGGGYTGSAPRSGGLDGKGGFMAMMHPQESVIDHTKSGGGSSGGGGGGSMSINISVNGARGNSEITEMVEAGVRQGLTQYDRSILPGRVNQISKDPRRLG